MNTSEHILWILWLTTLCLTIRRIEKLEDVARGVGAQL